jgi:hypothetical protein
MERRKIKTLILEEEKLFHKFLTQGEKKLIELMDSSLDKEIIGLMSLNYMILMVFHRVNT